MDYLTKMVVGRSGHLIFSESWLRKQSMGWSTSTRKVTDGSCSDSYISHPFVTSWSLVEACSSHWSVISI